MLKPEANIQPLVSREGSPFPPSAIDKLNARKSDEQYEPHSWEDLKKTIAENRLEVLKRWPSDIRKYYGWAANIKAEYGSVQNFVLEKRLNWSLSERTTPESGPLFDHNSDIPFHDPNDYRVLPNDWPYGLYPGISHLIVWSKIRLDTEPPKGDMTPKSRSQVQDFIQWKFIDRVKDLPEPEDRILWFKNWTALQSVPGMDHVHVLVRDIPEEIMKEWTGELVPH